MRAELHVRQHTGWYLAISIPYLPCPSKSQFSSAMIRGHLVTVSAESISILLGVEAAFLQSEIDSRFPGEQIHEVPNYRQRIPKGGQKTTSSEALQKSLRVVVPKSHPTLAVPDPIQIELGSLRTAHRGASYPVASQMFRKRS